MRSFVVFGRILSPFALLAALAVAPLGCGDSTPETGTKSEEPATIKQANNAMLDHVNKGKETPKK